MDYLELCSNLPEVMNIVQTYLKQGKARKEGMVGGHGNLVGKRRVMGTYLNLSFPVCKME